MKKAILFFSFVLVSIPLFAQTIDVKTHQLKNGMKVLVHEDHSIPSVALYIFYRIGSRNERPGITGLSHYFEHMMFNGAKKFGPKQFDIQMEAAGGHNNAYTDYDVTVYQDWFTPSALELIFDMEADRIQYLAFDPKIIESERGVVASERRSSVDANNFGLLNEQLWAAAYTSHPYQWPVVGWMVDIENWKMEDLKKHFEMGYSPSNATMVVTGAVKFEEIVRLAQKYIEPIPSHDPPPPVTTQEPEQLGERRVIVKKFAQLPIVMMGYHVPKAADADYYPLQVLNNILFAGESSRMYQRLVDKDQLALFVNGNLPQALDPTLFEIISQPKEGIAPDKVERAIYEELDKVKSSSVTDKELQKAKNALTAAFYRQMKTISGKANTLGSYEVFFGDYRKLFSAADEYAKVTVADVKRVAAKYFTEKNRTVATLIPEKEEAKADSSTATPAKSVGKKASARKK
ncbi:MAG: insulinase family protein [Acidobacteria bacterium]|nr:insulinase family protein [Acidobacteriota bacterium]